MRIRIEYFTESLQKRNDKLMISDDSTTDFLI